MGPNEKRLVTKRMAAIMIPPGAGPLEGFNALSNPIRLGEIAKEATEWVSAALWAVKLAPNNPYGNDNEVIAAAILEKM